MRLARESAIHEHLEDNADLDALLSDVDDDKTFAAMGVAKTISTVSSTQSPFLMLFTSFFFKIISSIDSSPEILSQIQEIVVPIIVFTLENRLLGSCFVLLLIPLQQWIKCHFLDLFDNMYELVDSLTYKLRSIAPSVWPIFELTYRLFKHEAVDFLEGLSITGFAIAALTWSYFLFFIEMLPSLDNFISYGADVIKARPEYKQMVVDIYTTSINNEQLGEHDRTNGSKLAESVLLNLRGAMDDVRSFLTFLAFHLDSTWSKITIASSNDHCYCPQYHR